MEINDLYKEVGWVVFRFSDASVQFLRTTLNPEILKSIPGNSGPRDNELYDLDKFKWVPLPQNQESLVEISVSAEKPTLSGVDLFVNRFI
jgi:hypothetical protein